MRKSRSPSPAPSPSPSPSPTPAPAPYDPRAEAARRKAARDAFIRRVVTFIGVHRACDLGVCRRAGACAGRHLPCYTERRDELRPILRSVLAHGFAAAEAAGEQPDVGPATHDGNLRILAAERAMAARIAAGTAPEDESAYGVWLRHVITPWLVKKGDLAPHQDDGSPYDPDATLRE